MNRTKFKDAASRIGNQYWHDELHKILDMLPEVSKEGPWLAGGAVRDVMEGRRTDSDYDFFFKDHDQFLKWVEEIENLDAKKVGETETNVTYKLAYMSGEFECILKIQGIVIKDYASLDEVLDSFDFTITQFGYDGEDLVFGEWSLFDLARRRLALHKLTYGASTVRRMIKYARKGFTACNGCIVQIFEAAIADPSLVNSDIQYVD